jgi:transcriptional regulator with XRE-family HTH domain
MSEKAKRSPKDDGLVRLDVYELKRLRLAKGWTIERFTRETGLHKRTADKIFHGGRIQLAVAHEVAAVFGIDNLLQIIDPGEYERPSGDTSGDEEDNRVRGTTEWEAPLAAVTEIITTSNNLQYRVYKLRHRHESTRLGRGKR